MRRVLVFGGGGWVGRALVRAIEARGAAVVAPRSAEADVTDLETVRRAVAGARPDAVVNLAACNPGQGDEARFHAVNAVGARNVATAAAEAGPRLVHVSTDFVLDGASPPYADDAPARPVSAYGRSKADGEAAAVTLHPDAVAVRTSLVFDPAEMDPSTRGFAEKLRRGEPCRLFTDEIRCPIARPALAAALAELTELRVRGTLNVAGTEPISRHDFGVLLLRWFRVRGRSRVERARAADLAEPRPLDLTLDVARARALLATPLRGVREVLMRARS